MNGNFLIKRLQRPKDAQGTFCCMTEVPTPWPEALQGCRDWFRQNLGEHVEGYHLQSPDGPVMGHLYYAPSEQALVPYEIEPGAAVIYCEWVQRRRQKQGLGRRLFETFVADMRQAGVKGVLVESSEQEERMAARHYLARGFQAIHQTEKGQLLYLPLGQAQVQVRPLRPSLRPRQGAPIEIVVVCGYLCPFELSTQLLVLEVAREFGDQVRLRQEPPTPESIRRYGVSCGIFINGQQKLSGGASEQAVRQAILEEL